MDYSRSIYETNAPLGILRTILGLFLVNSIHSEHSWSIADHCLTIWNIPKLIQEQSAGRSIRNLPGTIRFTLGSLHHVLSEKN